MRAISRKLVGCDMTTDPKIIEELSKALKERQLLVFCGAGVSKESKIPLARGFLEENGITNLSWRLGTEILKRNPDFKDVFHDTFYSESILPNDIHRMVAALDPPYVITTNYDRLLEIACAKIHGEDAIGVISGAKSLVGNIGKRIRIVKLHGDVEKQEMLVFSQLDYLRRWQTPHFVDGFVLYLLSTMPALFLGYGFDDAHIVDMLAYLSTEMNLPSPKRYLVTTETDEERLRYLRGLAIRPISVGSESRYQDSVGFLGEVWESRIQNIAFESPLKREILSVDEFLKLGTVHKQGNNLSKAQKVLDDLDEMLEGRFPELRSLPSYLWLNVSVKDKAEEWAKLDGFNDRIKIMLKTWAESLPARVFHSIRFGYESAFAISLIRQGRYPEADRILEDGEAYPPSSHADSSLQIVYADLLVTLALNKYCQAVVDLELPLPAGVNGREDLNKAGEYLTRALEIFTKYGRIGSDKEVHHMGRFFGTSALIESLSISSSRVGRVLSVAEKALGGSAQSNRTAYGAIAGRFTYIACCLNMCDQINDDALLGQIQSKAARILQDIDPEVLKQHPSVSLRYWCVKGLFEKVKSDRGRAQEMVLDCEKLIDISLRKKINEMSVERWMRMPVN